jgi:hypothetical protein
MEYLRQERVSPPYHRILLAHPGTRNVGVLNEAISGN